MEKFFAVIGNPPYQERDGGQEASAKPLYHDFAREAMKVSDRVSLVTPSRWFTGGRGLEDFRHQMLTDHHLRYIVDFHKLWEPFPNVKIRGGVSYWLWDRNYDGPCEVTNMADGRPLGPGVERYLDAYDVLIRRNEAVPILDKVASRGEPTLIDRVSASKPFGLRTNFHGPKTPYGMKDPVKMYESQTQGWIERADIPQNVEWVDKWKVLMNAVQGTSSAVETRFLNPSIIAGPGEACTETYVVAGLFDTEEEAKNYASYLHTRFARFLVSLRKVAQHASRNVYAFIPDVEYDHPWTDQMLYERYGLTDEEIAYIEANVREL